MEAAGGGHPVRLPALFAVATLAACSSSNGDSTLASGSVDASTLGDTSVDEAGALGCTSPLASDQPSLAELTSPSYCQKVPPSQSLLRWPVCQGLVLIEILNSADCGQVWIFDVSSGALVEQGGGCIGGAVACTSVPGFHVPDACAMGGSVEWEPTTLCPLGGADGGPDSASDGGVGAGVDAAEQ